MDQVLKDQSVWFEHQLALWALMRCPTTTEYIITDDEVDYDIDDDAVITDP